MTKEEFEREVLKLASPPTEFVQRSLVNIGEELLENSNPEDIVNVNTPISEIMHISAQETIAREHLKIPSQDFLKLPPSPMALYLRNR